MSLHFLLSFSAGVLGGAVFLLSVSWWLRAEIHKTLAEAETRMARVRGEDYAGQEEGY